MLAAAAGVARHLQVIGFATEAAAIKLRLIEQACGCSTVGGRGELKVRARICLWHSCPTVLAAAVAVARHMQVIGFATEAAAIKLRLVKQASLRLLHDARRTGTQARCVLVSASGTRVR